MKSSDQRILTTHAGRLQRPESITAAMEAHPRNRPTSEEFAGELRSAVADAVNEQVRSGVDIVNDGEFGKLSWASYLNGRLGGHELVPLARTPGERHETLVRRSHDREQFAEFYAEMERSGSTYYKSPGRLAPEGLRWACTGPVSYVGNEALRQDIQNLAAATSQTGAEEAFIPATSPIRPGANAYYATDEEYYAAVGEAMRTEYQAIVKAGFIVQIDDPHLPDLWGDLDVRGVGRSEYLKLAEQHVELINHALRGIPEDRIRYHICWGSWHGPHAYDLPLKDIVHVVLKVHAQGYVIEAANARHEHEWQVWQTVRLPDGKVLIPGVVAHATDTVEHPELVAWRIKNFASVVGRERVIAGTDCGLGYRVHPQIAWAKLRALAEGARLATHDLWPA